jgi:ribose transport system substrate-binding protein
MQRKVVFILLGLTMLLTLAVGNAFASGKKEVGTTVYVFGPTPDHGWTGSAARFAEEKIAELNKSGGGGYNYVFKSAAGPEAQIAQIEAMLAEGKWPAGVVIQCSDDAVKSAVENIVNAGIPIILFDRLVDESSPIIKEKMLIAMGADNYAVGAGLAYYFVQKGMTPGEAIWELPGDNSSATRERSVGFREFLLGTRQFKDDQGQTHTVPADKKWTEAQLQSSIVTSQVANWSRDNAKTYFEAYMSGKTPQTLAKWLFTQDDEFVMGILEYLQTPAKTAEREIFESTVKVVSGAGGLQALYDVLGRTKANAGNAIYQPDGISIVSASVRPGFFINAIQLMADHLAKKDITVHYTDKSMKRFMEPPHLVDTESYAVNKNNPDWRGFD